MNKKIIAMGRAKKIALVAHDHKKQDLVDWARFNQGTLSRHQLFSPGTTGRLIEEELGLPVTRLLSGPLGGDQQIGSMIAAGEIDFLIFFWDPLSPMPHDPYGIKEATAETLARAGSRAFPWVENGRRYQTGQPDRRVPVQRGLPWSRLGHHFAHLIWPPPNRPTSRCGLGS